MNLKAAELIEKQSQMAQGLIEQQQREIITPSSQDFDNAIKDLKTEIEGVDEEEAGEKIKNWIEKA